MVGLRQNDKGHNMEIGSYDLLRLAHVLLFVYWLGADLGVLYAAKFGADSRLSIETRQTIGEIMSFVDLFPRLSVPLIGAVGISMAVLSGDMLLKNPWLWLIWLAALVWVGVNLAIYKNRHRLAEIGSLLRFDVLWRSILLTLAATVAVASLLGNGVTTNASLAAKLLIYAIAIALSLVLRILFRPYRQSLAQIAAGGEDAENTAIMKKSLSNARPVVFAIWFLTVAAAALGLWQPL